MDIHKLIRTGQDLEIQVGPRDHVDKLYLNAFLLQIEIRYRQEHQSWANRTYDHTFSPYPRPSPSSAAPLLCSTSLVRRHCIITPQLAKLKTVEKKLFSTEKDVALISGERMQKLAVDIETISNKLRKFVDDSVRVLREEEGEKIFAVKTHLETWSQNLEEQLVSVNRSLSEKIAANCEHVANRAEDNLCKQLRLYGKEARLAELTRKVADNETRFVNLVEGVERAQLGIARDLTTKYNFVEGKLQALMLNGAVGGGVAAGHQYLGTAPSADVGAPGAHHQYHNSSSGGGVVPPLPIHNTPHNGNHNLPIHESHIGVSLSGAGSVAGRESAFGGGHSPIRANHTLLSLTPRRAHAESSLQAKYGNYVGPGGRSQVSTTLGTTGGLESRLDTMRDSTRERSSPMYSGNMSPSELNRGFDSIIEDAHRDVARFKTEL